MAKQNRFQTTQKANRGPRIETHEASGVNYQLQKPVFSFEFLDTDKEYSLERNDRKGKSQFVSKLMTFSRIKWRDIEVSDRHGLGRELIPKAKIRGKIPARFANEDKFMMLRFSGKRPMGGIRSKNIFYIIWIDWNFSLYKH